MQFSYNVLNLPETVTKSDGSCSLTYTYLSDGTKVRAKVDGGFGSVYKGGFICTEEPGGALSVESIAWDEGRIIIGSDGTVAQDQWYVRDHLGNVRSVIDLKETTVAAAVKEQSDYLPFGTRVDMTNQGSGASDNRWRYAGKEEQRFGSGLFGIDLAKIDFGARFYDPNTARWTTPDPLASKYPAVSPYTYCANDPVNRFDPDGRSPKDKLWGVIMGVVTNIIPGSDKLRDAYSPDDLTDYNSALKYVDATAAATGGAMMATGIGGLGAGTTVASSGVAMSASGVGAIAGIPAVEVGAAVAISSAAIGIAGVRLLVNAGSNSKGGYRRGKDYGLTPKDAINKSRKGRIPSDIDRIDNAHTPRGKIHAHDKYGSGINVSGSGHDKKHGFPPKFSKKTWEWLERHGWDTSNIKDK